MCEVIEFVVERFEDLLEAYGPDFSFALAKDLLWYLRLKNGMYIADSTEGRFIDEIENIVRNEDIPFTQEDERFILSELLLYITSRLNVELGQVVKAQNAKIKKTIDHRSRKKLI